MYGLVGVAMHLVVGVLIVASAPVISSGWLITLLGVWAITAVVAALLWRRTVWVALLASLVLSAVWMMVFFGSR
jgi:hypothetical protein